MCLGDYVMVIGRVQGITLKERSIVAFQVINLSEQVNRESLWSVEVMENWTK